jgi:hypothetical protein
LPEGADRVWRIVGKDADRAQSQVEVDLLLSAASVYLAQGVDQFDTVTDGDVGDVSALAREDRRDPGRRHPCVDAGAGRLCLGESLQLGEPLRVSGVRHHTGKTGVCAGQHPR